MSRSTSRFLFFLLLLSCLTSNAQKGGYIPKGKAKDYYQRALKSSYSRDYEKVEEFCNKAEAEDPDYEDAYVLLARTYEQLGKFDLQANEYKELLQHQPDNVTALLNLGTALYNHGDYKEASGYYEKFLSNPAAPPTHKKIITDRMKIIRTGLTLMNNPVPFNPINLGPEVNTANDEYYPSLTVDGETLYFTRKKNKGSSEKFNDMFAMNPSMYNEDIMSSTKKNGSWQRATDVSELNTPDNEGAMCVSPDGSFMILTGCNREDGLGSCDLYIAFFRNGQWTKPINMGEPVNSRFQETQPSISFDGRTIYFASKRPGSLGGTDIYMSTRDDKWNFAEPVNLGPTVNTPGDEQVPYIHPDDQTLYFASNGWPGIGRNDIFVCHRKPDGNFDTAINIGYPINTSGDEFGMVVDRLGENAYYSSSGNKSIGGLDIFYFKLPEKAKPKIVTYLKGKVFDAETKAPLTATFELADLESGKSIIKSVTSSNGEFLVPVPEGKDYLVNVSAKGYLFYSDNIPLKNYRSTDPYLKDIPLPPIRAGQKITLRNIFFKTDAYTLKQESTLELDRVIAFLKANPAIKIEISGHTDNTGTPAHNKDLSLKRAQTVYNYLINQGKLPAARLQFAGYGETQPIAANTSEEGKAQNRRTELKIIE